MKRVFQKISTEQGFTLIEVVIAMALFIGVLVIASNAFNTIITQSSKVSKMEETNIEGVIGLEIMRHDLEQMGFGLPWKFATVNTLVNTDVRISLTYEESTHTFGHELNDASNVPRAFVGLSPGNFNNAAYISVKGTTAGRSNASQRWTYIPYLNFSAATRQSRPVQFASNNLETHDRVIILNSSPNATTDANINPDRALVVGTASSSPPNLFYTSYHTGVTESMETDYLPTAGRTYMVYGIDTPSSTSDVTRMPFNRADYFIGSSSVPSFCASGTGVLYKGNVNHNGGGYDYLPLLDCVADMQVVLGWDTSMPTNNSGQLTGTVDAYSSLSASSGGAVSAAITAESATASASEAATRIQAWLIDPKGLREHLKIVKVYILAQEGKRDASYNAPLTTIEVGDQVADGGLTPKKTYTLSTAQQKYRWKLYRIVVRPRNLFSNSY